MGLIDAIFYTIIGVWIIPHNRTEVPFKQFGFDVEQFLLIFTEAALYEASAVEMFKSVVCATDYEYGVAKGWCYEFQIGNDGYEEDPNSKYNKVDAFFKKIL